MKANSSEERKDRRREEILAACEKLYGSLRFQEITMKQISELTSFTRPSIYNYFPTKEEIFLALFTKEYDRWIEDLDRFAGEHPTMDADAFADGVAQTLSRRGLLLKLLSMNLYDMEESSRPEALARFKESFGGSFAAVGRCLDRLSPALPEAAKENFLYSFFPFMYGIYPYTSVTEKQKTAMEQAGFAFREHTIYDLTRTAIRSLLSGTGGTV